MVKTMRHRNFTRKEWIKWLARITFDLYPCKNYPYCCNVFSNKAPPRMGMPCYMSIECQEIYKLFPDAFALQIDGDSMAPRINDADIVILSPSVPAAQGYVAVARLADQIGVTCKLIRTTQSQVHLIPINERYETKTMPKENLLWALAVLCHIKI